jgi:hypothetical protein
MLQNIPTAPPSSAAAASEDKACRMPHHVGWAAAGGENGGREGNWRELKPDVALTEGWSHNGAGPAGGMAPGTA